MEEDICIVKFHFSNLHKVVITRFKATETLKNRSFIDYLIKALLCISFLMLKIDVYKSSYPVHSSLFQAPR